MSLCRLHHGGGLYLRGHTTTAPRANPTAQARAKEGELLAIAPRFFFFFFLPHLRNLGSQDLFVVREDGTATPFHRPVSERRCPAARER